MPYQEPRCYFGVLGHTAVHVQSGETISGMFDRVPVERATDGPLLLDMEPQWTMYTSDVTAHSITTGDTLRITLHDSGEGEVTYRITGRPGLDGFVTRFRLTRAAA